MAKVTLRNRLFPSGGKLPIVYSRRYDIHLFGLAKKHPFDAAKYGRVYRYVVKHLGIPPRRFYRPRKATLRQLLSVHTLDYLNSLHDARHIARIVEWPNLSSWPGWLLYRKILVPMQYATGGTLLGVELALDYGWCINLGGGFHHASGRQGAGFCCYADIPIAAYHLLRTNRDLSVLIVDLDAHQGNGCAEVFKHDPNIRILDIYNPFIFPGNRRVRDYVDLNCPVLPGISEIEYLSLVKSQLRQAIDCYAPDLIIYVAGTDVLSLDPLGGMNISEQGVIARDADVFSQALANRIPILMLLSGGYGRENAQVIARSVEHLLRNVLRVS
ncbi:MAG: histone deacetylase [Candidatus Competibacteraceae bacterium]|jgi:histone deacetylase 11|nr:histone deacetylase [Candidatus Competibacteraceae bacterium]